MGWLEDTISSALDVCNQPIGKQVHSPSADVMIFDWLIALAECPLGSEQKVLKLRFVK